MGLLAALAIATAPAAAEEAPLQAADLQWESLPTGRDFARMFPIEAQRHDVEGRATLTCRIGGGRTLEACKVMDEAPEGLGFGGAAISLARKFKLKTDQRDPRAVAGVAVALPILFKHPR